MAYTFTQVLFTSTKVIFSNIWYLGFTKGWLLGTLHKRVHWLYPCLLMFSLICPWPLLAHILTCIQPAAVCGIMRSCCQDFVSKHYRSMKVSKFTEYFEPFSCNKRRQQRKLYELRACIWFATTTKYGEYLIITLLTKWLHSGQGACYHLHI